MKTLFLLFSFIVMVSFSSRLHARSQTLIYDIQSAHTLNAFELFPESPDALRSRPRLGLSPNGLVALPGEGNFTAWKFADTNEQAFVLDVFFVPPADAVDSNSGIFLLQTDPRQDLRSLPPRARQQFENALMQAQQQKRDLGPGPMELNFFGYEVQLARGEAVAGDPVNKRSGTFYGVPVGGREGEQQILNQYDLNPGDLYQLRILSKNGRLATYLRSVRYQRQFVPIARMKTRPRVVDAVRGYAPISLLLQAYWNNGTTAKSIEFKRIVINRLR